MKVSKNDTIISLDMKQKKEKYNVASKGKKIIFIVIGRCTNGTKQTLNSFLKALKVHQRVGNTKDLTSKKKYLITAESKKLKY